MPKKEVIRTREEKLVEGPQNLPDEGLDLDAFVNSYFDSDSEQFHYYSYTITSEGSDMPPLVRPVT